MTASPARTATFLMTDIEGSTRLWEEQRPAMVVALEAHDTLLRAAVEQAGGSVVKTTGDGLLAAFDRPDTALAAAVEGQRALDRQAWPATGPLRVRMAIHSGSAEVRDGDFFGPTLNRVARLMAIGHGGQVLVSGATSALVAGALPEGCDLVDLGEHRLKDLDQAEHVYQLVTAGLRREFPPLRSVAANPTNLRPPATTFVGREQELAEVRRLLDTSRLVTLLGTGGTGKTRLLMEIGAGAVDRYRDGTWLVELGPITDPDLVATEIGRVLGIQLQPGRSTLDSIAADLRPREMLLLLDNCEQVVEAVADAAAAMLGRCPGVRLLASSRERLDIDGEAVFHVPSLALPVAPGDNGLAAPEGEVTEDEIERALGSEAVRLFVDRATATQPSFAVDRDNVRSVVDICRRLDGIPLALELAAARINVLSAAEIARGLDDRFHLLTGGRRTAVPRQRTLQGLIDWSWDLLDEDDRRLLRRLAVFAGGWTLDEAGAITGERTSDGGAPTGAARMAALDGLGRLVDRSLVTARRDGVTRYGMLETIREYARVRLEESGEGDRLRTLHLATFRQLAVDAELGLKGPDMLACLERLDTEIDNLRAALDWAWQADTRAALEMAVGLAVYWNVRLIGSEGYDRLLQAVDLARSWLVATADPVERRERAGLAASVLAHAAQVIASYTGRPADPGLGTDAVGLARESEDPDVLATTYATLAFARVAVDGLIPLDGPDRLLALEALELAERRGDWYHVSIITSAFAMTAYATDPDAGRAWLDRASAAADRTGNLFALGNITGLHGRTASMMGRLDEAEHWLLEARERYKVLHDRRFYRVLTSELAHVLRRQGRLDEAEAEYRGTIRGWQSSGNDGAVANQLECFGYIALARGQAERAARLLGAADALREVAGAPMTAFEHGERDAAMGALRAGLDPEAVEAAWSEGRRMTVDAAVALALSATA